MMSDSLTRKSTVNELVAAFQRAELEVRTCYARLVEAERAINEAYLLTDSSHAIRIDASYDGYRDNYANPQQTIDRMARDAWNYIVDRLEVRRLMSIERTRQLNDQLYKGDLPPITEANVIAFVEGYMGSLGQMFEEAVCEVFQWLRPRSDKYKTNSQLEIGERVVLAWVIEQADKRWRTERYSVNHRYRQNLIALENVFNGLAGNGQVNEGNVSALEAAIVACPRGEGHGKTDLFEFRVFDNGNMHLRFRRLDLLKRLNMIAGGRRLRPAAPEASEDAQCA